MPILNWTLITLFVTINIVPTNVSKITLEDELFLIKQTDGVWSIYGEEGYLYLSGTKIIFKENDDIVFEYDIAEVTDIDANTDWPQLKKLEVGGKYTLQIEKSNFGIDYIVNEKNNDTYNEIYKVRWGSDDGDNVIFGYDGRWDRNEDSYQYCTHIVDAFDVPDFNNRESGYLNNSNYEDYRLFTNKVNNLHKTSILGIGGAGSSEDFYKICINSDSRSRFIKEIADRVTGGNYGGVDIDWEPIEPNHKQYFKQLIIELRQILGEQSLITFPVEMSKSKHYSLDETSEYTDYCILMAYDYNYNNWDKPNSPWNKVKRDIKGFIKNGYPSNKLVLALPFYWKWGESNSIGWDDFTEHQREIIRSTEMNTKYLEKKYDVGVTVWGNDCECLTTKYKEAKDEFGLAGVGVWMLGHDKDCELIKGLNTSKCENKTQSNNTTCTDIDGNVYETVQIGNQIWMAENLKVTHYRNGDPIPTGLSNNQWTSTSSGAYAVYDNNESNADTYGYLYNWYAVDDARGLAPEGWHIPTDEEWMELEMALGMSESEANDTGYRGTDQGSQLAGRADLWSSGDLENNANFGTSGFNALPAGYRYYDGNYSYMGNYGYFWSSSEDYYSNYAWNRRLYYNYSEVTRYTNGKKDGFVVRCVRD